MKVFVKKKTKQKVTQHEKKSGGCNLKLCLSSKEIRTH